MEIWMCPQCGKRIYGSLHVVLLLASAHVCSALFTRKHVTTCLSCLDSPTGLCAYHASVLVNSNRLNLTRVQFLQ